ncbi:hypothetical protein TorRG33x02_135910 [Trema orientale]|uniref:RNase H type-1 domain-containing protein n=1 Tax=Trema orientale TaxID=63057 RepID=A0A2P5EYC7_TREOI|nr:hypothetical protein TorRG33x02_135910 [Trema orientale]
MILAHSFSKEIFELICVILWAIWTRRNNKLFNGVSLDALELSYWCKYYLEEFQACKLRIELAPSVPRSSGVGFWNRPRVGCIKLNVDTVDHDALNFVGVGGTICDHEGCILVYWVLKIPGKFDILTSELLAIREDVHLAIQFGFLLYNIESDSLLTITAFNHVQPCSTVESIISDIKLFISSTSYDFYQHISRVEIMVKKYIFFTFEKKC